MSISPVHVVALKFAVFTCTVIVLGVAPDCCESTIQLVGHMALVVVLVVAVKPTFAPVLLVIERVCAGGWLVPDWKAKESCDGLTLIAGVPATVTSTGMLIPVVPGALIAIAPL